MPRFETPSFCPYVAVTIFSSVFCRGKIFHTILTPSHCVDFPYLVSLAGAEKITLRLAPAQRCGNHMLLCVPKAYRGAVTHGD